MGFQRFSLDNRDTVDVDSFRAGVDGTGDTVRVRDDRTGKSLSKGSVSC